MTLPIVGDLISSVVKVAGKFITDKDKLNEIEAGLKEEMGRQDSEIIKTLASVDVAQTEVNKIEASSSSFFVSGWRSFIGWVCGVGLGFAFVVKPVADWLVAIWYPKVVLPQLSVAELSFLTANMLGFSAVKTFEKIKGVR